MPRNLKVLIVEDNPADAELILRELRRSGFTVDWERVDTEKAYVDRLDGTLDLILSDYSLPEFSGVRALNLLRERGIVIPFILVSGTIGEDTAVAVMKEGAYDYLIKDRLARLGQAVHHALLEGKLQRDRLKTERELRLFRALVDQSDDTLEIVDPLSGRILDVNGKGPVQLGCTREEYLSMRVYDIEETMDPADWPKLVSELRNSGTFRSEGSHRRKDGTSFPVEFTSSWVQLDKDYIVTVVRDVTERRRAESELRASEERFRQLAENINEVFWMLDRVSGKILYVSPRFQSVWGRTCESLYAKANIWFESIHPEDRERVVNAAREKMQRGDYDETYRILTPNATVRWIRERAFPIREGSGEIRRIVGTAEDITEYRKLESQFRQAQKMEAIGTLAGGIAHDFNNILTAIIGYTEFARMDAAGLPEITENLDAVLHGTKRATDLVRQILTFSRRQEQKRSVLQLAPVLTEALNLLRATISTAIDFEVQLANDAPRVLADVTQIHQIMMNLGSNAAYAMRERPGRLTIRLERCDVDSAFAESNPGLHKGVYALLSITDTGQGMDTPTLSRIFEPFFTTKEPGQGTGLGLAAVHGIMQRHEGAILVSSHLGKGTTFTLYFPAYEGDMLGAEEQSPTQVPRGDGEKILYVDDEAPLSRLGQRILERLGYQVDTKTKAFEAIEAMVANPNGYDLVVTDQAMPGLTGVELAHRLIAIRPNIPIILTTGFTASLTAERIQAMGIRRLVMKPFSLETLGRNVHEVLEEAKDRLPRAT